MIDVEWTRKEASYIYLQDFFMRESVLTIRGLIESEVDLDAYRGVLWFDQDYLLSLNFKEKSLYD